MDIHSDKYTEISKYTIVFDLFGVGEIFDCHTKTSALYIDRLVKKGVVGRNSSFKSSGWASEVLSKRDIFLPRDPNLKAAPLNIPSWKERIQRNCTILNNTQKSAGATDSIDYRFSAIEITPIDLNDKAMPFTRNIRRTQSTTGEGLCAELLGLGVVRLFKDSDNRINVSKIDTQGLKHVPGDDTTVAIFSVPFYFSASDLLLGFFDEEDTKHISHLRLIKSSSPNRFMILLKFREKDDVKPFMRKYQGRKFNSFEPELCSVIEIKEIVFRPRSKTEIENLKSAIPYLLEDPFTNETSITNGEIGSSRKLMPKYVELATCPVCLDRLDSSVTGLFTIPCQHTFHSSCLSKWTDDTCPVCRYSNKDRSSKLSSEFSMLNVLDDNIATTQNLDSTEKCMTCGLEEHLWICLICGNVGCGRYEKQHAIDHWENTGHCFAMETNTQRVWDYAEDGYVHRLVQNEADGKIVELPLRDESKKSSDAKVEKIGFEYSKLLIGQLESQREFYENIIKEKDKDLAFQKDTISKIHDKMNQMETQFSRLGYLENRVKEFELETARNNEIQKKFENATVLNNALIQKLKFFEKDNSILLKEKNELQEQVTDLMFFLENQEKFKDASSDVVEGQIVIVPKDGAK